MGKIDDIQAYKEWTEYHRSLKRDKAADNLSPVERKKKLEKLEGRDGELWRKVTGYVITAVIGIVLGFVFRHIGM